MSRSARQLQDSYELKKQALVEEFKKNLEGNGTFSLKKRTTNLSRPRESGCSKKLDLQHFNQIISIDPVELVAVVEGMITFEDLVHETLKYNCLPPVVPELKTITIGGALVGLGIESSSFRYGLVHETVLEIEILAGDGTIVISRPDNEHSDLFFAFPNSFGTLGYALKVKMKLIPAKKYVRLTNLHFSDINSFFEKINELCLKQRSLKTDSYIDGVIFDKNEMAIILGEFVDEAPYLSDYTYMKSYYPSIGKRTENYLTAKDYIWRWDADWFWCSKYFGMNNRILRFLLGKFMLQATVYRKIYKFIIKTPVLNFLFNFFKKPTEAVIQDILIPIQNAPDFSHFLGNSIGIKPIWICPFHFHQNKNEYPLVSRLDPKILYIDFGVWGHIVLDKYPNNLKNRECGKQMTPKPDTSSCFGVPRFIFNRSIEYKTEELSGFKSLYSSSYYSEEEFWRIYPKNDFSKLKAKYDPKGVFHDLYEKCVLGK